MHVGVADQAKLLSASTNLQLIKRSPAARHVSRISTRTQTRRKQQRNGLANSGSGRNCARRIVHGVFGQPNNMLTGSEVYGPFPWPLDQCQLPKQRRRRQQKELKGVSPLHCTHKYISFSPLLLLLLLFIYAVGALCGQSKR